MILALLCATWSAAGAFEPLYDPVVYPPEVFPEDPIVGGEVRTDDGGALILRHTEIVAEIHAGVARVTMVQHFQNPYDAPLEATYLLPLPADAAVDTMELQVGDRVTEAWVMERDAARQLYEDAVEEGKRAALLEQERENLFRQSVAGICPDENVTITLQYAHLVEFEDGLYTLSLPTTVGPRFDPPWVAAEDAAAVDTPHARATGTTVSVTAILDEGLPVEVLYSDTHDVDVIDEGTWGAEVRLLDDVAPDRDFVLSWSLAGAEPRAAVVAHKPGEDAWGYAAVTLEPQLLGDMFVARPRELLFVIDESCSMRGEPYETARATVERALSEMRETDTFNLVKFGSESSSLFRTPQPSSPQTVAQARQWLRHFDGGGTNMDAGIVHSLNMPGDPEAMRLVLLLTDGFISGERPMFDVVRENLGDARLFSLGIGHSVNRFLLEGLAEMGRGDVAYHIPGGTSIAQTVTSFYGRIAHPAMSDVEIDWGELEVVDAYPEHVPDLWAGQPVRVVARYARGGTAEVVVRGKVGTARVELPLQVTLPEVSYAHDGIASLWARRRIRDIEWYPGARSSDQVREEVTEIALEHHLVSAYTSLVAVDDEPCPCGAAARTEEVPHDAPHGLDLIAAGGSYGAAAGSGYGSAGSHRSANGIAANAGLMGALGSSSGGVAYGVGGLGSRGSGLGGGGSAQGPGWLGTKGVGSGAAGYGGGGGSFGAKASAPIASVASDPIVLGAMDKTLIEDVIRRHLNAIRYCYQRELQKDASLAGRLAVKFVIAADGTVSTASAQASSLNNATVEQCVAGRFQRMQFPRSPGGGIVVVTYPIVFSAQ